MIVRTSTKHCTEAGQLGIPSSFPDGTIVSWKTEGHFVICGDPEWYFGYNSPPTASKKGWWTVKWNKTKGTVFTLVQE